MQFFLSSTAQTFSLVIICCFWKKLKSMQYNKQAELDFFLSGGLYEHGDNAYRFVFQQSLFRQNKSILTAGQEEGEGTGLSVKLRGFAAPLVAPFLLVGMGG
jgi:hypothetical protein